MEKRDAPLATALKAERERRSWSQSRLARELEVPERTIGRWEHGTSEPNHRMFERICELFGWELPYSRNSAKASKLSPSSTLALLEHDLARTG